MQHYRCFKCYIPTTRLEQITDTVVFLPHNIKIPKTTPETLLQQAISDILKFLKTPLKHLPFIQKYSTTSEALKKVTSLFKQNHD